MKLHRPLAVFAAAVVVAAPAVVMVGAAEAAPRPTKVKFQSSAISVAEAAGQAVVTLRRTGNASGSTTVNYSVTDGSATSGEDYGTATPGSLTFAPKVKKLTFAVPIVNDTADESDETILLTLTGTVPAGQVGSPSSATITIVDDDDASTPSLPDDLEGDTSGWTATGLWHLIDDASCATAPFNPFPVPAYTSATHAFYYGDDTLCTYDTPGVRNSGTLTSPNYSGISGATSVSFQSYLYTEGDYCQNDIASVDVSYDGGTTWTPLEACVPDNAVFQLKTYAITPIGDTVRFRFTFDTMDHGLNDYPGWFIDDLSVSAG